MRSIIDQAYCVRNGTQLKFDFYAPESAPPLPLIICIHGGGWISGCKEDMAEAAAVLARQGFAVACPEYRLAPLHTCPAAIEDVREFVMFAKENAGSLGYDASRIASFGNSAGGHLAAMVGLSSRSDQRVDAVVSICPITDLTRPREQHFPIAWSFLEQFMGASWEEDEELHRAASPLWQVSADAPPFLVYHGAEDDIVPVAQSEAFVESLRRVGGNVEYHRLEGELHGMSFDAWQEIVDRTTSFLKEVLA